MAYPLYLTYTAPNPIKVERYSITSANDAQERDPSVFSLEGSNDSVDWENIEHYGINRGTWFRNRYEKHTYTVNPSKAYKYIRLKITSLYFTDPNNLSSLFQLAEWQLFGTVEGTDGISSASIVADVDGDTPVAVYSLQGIKLGTVTGAELDAYLKSLPRGIYIVNGRKVRN